MKQILDHPSSLKGPEGLEYFTCTHQILPIGLIPLDARIVAPPSLRPQARYCDITGLPANYLDPQTGLRYHSSAAYQYIRTLTPEAVQRILQLRNAGTII